MSLSGIGKGLVKGLSFLGGGNPLSGALGVGGAIASGVAQGGRQGQVNTNQTGTQNVTGTTQQTQGGTVANQESEIPELTAFRQGLIPEFEQELQRAKGPVFGEAQQADFINRVNDTTNQAFESINQRLAGRGAGASGQLVSDTTDLELARGSQLSDFFSQLPFREEQARSERLNPLLSAGLSFAGRGPGGNTQTQDLTTTGQTQQDTTSAQQTGQETRGPGALGGILGELGALGGRAAGELFGGGDTPLPFDESLITQPTAPTNGAIDPLGGPPQFKIFPQQQSFQTPVFFGRR